MMGGMNQTDLSAALTIGKVVRVRLKDGRTLQGLLEEAQTGDGAGSLKFRPLAGSEPRVHRFSRPEDVLSVETLATAG